MENLESNENSLPNHTASLDIKKRTLYLDTLDNIKVYELKKMNEDKACVFKVKQYKIDIFYRYIQHTAKGLTTIYRALKQTALVTYPVILGLIVQRKDGSFEGLEITSYSDIEWLQLLQLDVKDPKYEKYAIWQKMLLNFNSRNN